MQKVYVLDTSSIISHPSALSLISANNNIIIIPAAVIKELDKHKTKDGDIGINARKAVRSFMQILNEKEPTDIRADILSLGNYYTYSFNEFSVLFSHYSSSGSLVGDEGILFEIENIVKSNKNSNVNYDITLISEDNLLKIRALSIGAKICSIDEFILNKNSNRLFNEEVLSSKSANAKPVVVEVSDDNKFMSLIEKGKIEVSSFFEEKIQPHTWFKFVNDFDGFKLELDVYSDFNSRHFRVFNGSGFEDGGIKLSKNEQKIISGIEAFGLKPLNDAQKLALAFLLDDRIPFVTIEGGAGTGKTILSMAAGLEKTLSNSKYEKLLYTRPTIAIGQQLGFLPGEISSKLAPWIAPLRDNVAALFETKLNKKNDEEYSLNEGGGKKKNKYDIENFFSLEENKSGKSLSGLGELEKQGILEIEPLQFIRGRSLPKQFFIIDEAQNLTRHEVKTILTRAGEGTKIILLGDPDQIDVPGLTKEKCGLVVAREAFNGSSFSAHVKLTEGVRSDLASEAAKRL